MSRERPENQELTPEELEQQKGEPLPERAAMTVVNPGQGFHPPPLPLVLPEEPIDGGPYVE
jgi:hypothetical protein